MAAANGQSGLAMAADTAAAGKAPACRLDNSPGAAEHHGATSLHEGSATALQLLQEFLQVQACRAEVYSRFSQGFRDLLDHGQQAVFARLMHEVTPAFNAASQQVIQIESLLKAPTINRPDLAALLRGVQEHERLKLRLTLSWQALRAAHASGRFSWQDAADRSRTQVTAAAQQTQQRQEQHHLQHLLDQLQLQQGHAASSVDEPLSDVVPSSSDQGESGAAAVKPGFYEQQMQRAVADALAATSRRQDCSAEVHPHPHSSVLQCGAAAGHHGCHHGHQHEPADPLEPNPLEPTEAEFNAALREALQELDRCVRGINELLDEVREAVQDLEGNDS